MRFEISTERRGAAGSGMSSREDIVAGQGRGMSQAAEVGWLLLFLSLIFADGREKSLGRISGMGMRGA